MKVQLTQKTSLEAICNYLIGTLPQYKVSIKKPAFGQFVVVKKNGWVGVTIKYNEKKDNVIITSIVPSPVNRVLFGGLLLVIINMVTTRTLRDEVADALKNIKVESEIFG
jgi:hypothetical protein